METEHLIKVPVRCMQCIGQVLESKKYCNRSRVQRFKGCILITIRHFVNVLYAKAFAVKALRRMNGDSTFYNLFGSGVSCL
jgi:hypothetical protein